MFRFAWSSYRRHAFPHDEVRPITCRAADPFGGYSTTVVDALDTFVVRCHLRLRRRFRAAHATRR